MTRSNDQMNEQSRILAARVKLRDDLSLMLRRCFADYREIRARQAEAWREEQKGNRVSG